MTNLVEECCPSDVFENSIRKYGVVAACEWFGYTADSEFTKSTIAALKEREAQQPKESSNG